MKLFTKFFRVFFSENYWRISAAISQVIPTKISQNIISKKPSEYSFTDCFRNSKNQPEIVKEIAWWFLLMIFLYSGAPARKFSRDTCRNFTRHSFKKILQDLLLKSFWNLFRKYVAFFFWEDPPLFFQKFLH